MGKRAGLGGDRRRWRRCLQLQLCAGVSVYICVKPLTTVLLLSDGADNVAGVDESQELQHNKKKGQMCEGARCGSHLERVPRNLLVASDATLT